MIIQNGTIEVKCKSGGGIDAATGHAVKAQSTWGKPIACQWLINSQNKQGIVNGEHYILAKYTVLIEQQPFCGEQIRLKDLCGNIVGEFSIISVEPLDAVCEIRILI